jgi:hypothetical protein
MNASVQKIKTSEKVMVGTLLILWVVGIAIGLAFV